jgi:hypothetical protein
VTAAYTARARTLVTKMMFWALAGVTFRAAKIVSCNKNFFFHSLPATLLQLFNFNSLSWAVLYSAVILFWLGYNYCTTYDANSSWPSRRVVYMRNENINSKKPGLEWRKGATLTFYCYLAEQMFAAIRYFLSWDTNRSNRSLTTCCWEDLDSLIKASSVCFPSC